MPFSHILSAQTEFHICCAIYYALKNGRKYSKKSLEWCAKMAHNADHSDRTYRKKIL